MRLHFFRETEHFLVSAREIICKFKTCKGTHAVPLEIPVSQAPTPRRGLLGLHDLLRRPLRTAPHLLRRPSPSSVVPPPHPCRLPPFPLRFQCLVPHLPPPWLPLRVVDSLAFTISCVDRCARPRTSFVGTP